MYITGNLRIYYTDWENSGNSLTTSTANTTLLFCYYVCIYTPITITAVNGKLQYTKLGAGLNAISLTTVTSGTTTAEFCHFGSGTSSSISVGTGTTVQLTNCMINSTNTNALTGAGTLVSNGTIFDNTSHQSNVTTQTGGAASGLTQGTAPSAGFIGEQIRGFVAGGSAVSVSNGTYTNITSVALTPGIWDVCAIAMLTGMTTGTLQSIAISTANNTGATKGDSQIDLGQTSTTNSGDMGLSIPGYRITLSALQHII